MSDSWINKNENEIRDDIVSIAKQETGLTNFKNTGVLRGFIEVIMRVVLFIYQSAINPIHNNASLDDATGFFLSLWGLMLGVVRKHETRATGIFTGTAYGDGSVAAGTWAVVEGSELRYKVTEKISFQTGTTFAIPVTAEYAGISYNIGPDTPIRFTRVITGLDTVFIGLDWIVSPGQEEEADDPYRFRIKDRWRSQILGDTKEVYRYYAEEVNGVKSARIIRTPRGPGTTDVIVSSIDGLPNDELLEAVRLNLYNHELLGFDVQVKPPSVIDILIQIEYSGDASESEVTLIADGYVSGLGIGDRLKVSDLYDLYKLLNLNSIEILSPVRDIQPSSMSIFRAAINVQKVSA